MVLLMVPMVPLERWGGGQAFWQKNSRKQGILTGSCKALVPGPRCKSFVLLSPRGGAGSLAPDMVTFLSATKILPVAGLCQGSMGAGAGRVQRDVVAGRRSGDHQERRGVGGAHDPAGSKLPETPWGF